jgi:O-antigen/teichoic acid export membrane protein/thymidylate kinase
LTAPGGASGLTRRTLAGLAWTGGGRAVYAVLRLVVLFLLARFVSPADFGVVGAATVVLGFSAIFSELGMAPAIVQRPVLELRHEQAAFSASVAFGLVLGAIMWVLAPEIAGFFRIPAVQPVLRTFAWTFPLAGLSLVAYAVTQRELRFRWLAILDVVSFGVGYGIVGVTLALTGYGVWALVAAEMSRVGLYTAILVIAHPPRFTLRPDRKAFAELMYYGSGFTVSKIANYLALQLDNVIVGRWLGAVALGFYGRAYELMAAAPALLGEPVDKVLFPAMAARQGDRRSLASAYRRGVATMALITLPLSVLLVVLAPEAVPALLGPKWTPVIVPFQILTLGIFLRTSYRISDVVARATGAVYRRAWRQTAYMLFVIAGAWFGRRWGIAGVAIGVLGALTVNYLLMAQLGVRVAGLSWRHFWGAHLHALLTAAVLGALVGGSAVLLRAWALSPVAVLVTAGVLGLGGTLLLVWSAPRAFLGEDGIWILRQVRELALGRATTPPVAASVPGGETLLSLVRQLGEALELQGINYCQWKGHSKRHRWATGAGDIDLLVDPADKRRLVSVLQQLGFTVALAPPRHRLPGVESYFGLDRATGKFVHVHAHERLFVGRPWVATYAMPLEGLFLASASQRSVFRTPAPEVELIGLVIRTVERYRLTTALRRRLPEWSEAVRQELSDLEGRSDPDTLARALEQVPFLDARFFQICRESLSPACPGSRRLLVRWRLLGRLRRATARPISVAVMSLLRRAGRGPAPLGKRLAHGIVIALAGADGAGKSSCTRALADWLSPTFACTAIHLGRPRRSLLTLGVGAALWGRTLLYRLFGNPRPRTPLRNEVPSGRVPDSLELLRHVCTARDRYRLALKAQRLAAGGAFVLCERYPNITTLAGPSIQQQQYPMPTGGLARWLVTTELEYYRVMPPPDLGAVLLVDPELAVQRKQGREPADYVRYRAQLVKQRDWTGTGLYVVDANRPLPDVVRDLQYLIWAAASGVKARRCLTWSVPSQPYPRHSTRHAVVVELVGPAGAGKSTVADLLGLRPDVLQSSIWGLPLGSRLWSATALLPTFLQLCWATRGVPWKETKEMIRLTALRRVLPRLAARRYRLIILDEGPVFALSWLRVFGDERLLRSGAYQRWVQRTLALWARCIDVVALMDAPDGVLSQRIRARVKPHMVKHQSDREIAAFAARFRAAFAAVIPGVTALNGTKQFTVRADLDQPQQLAGQVLQAVEEAHPC